MANPTIKVSADLSSFEQELSKCSSLINDLGSSLKTASGKNELNMTFGLARAEVDKLTAQFNKMLSVLEKSDKTSAQYIKHLKETQKVAKDLATVTAKAEQLGDLNPKSSTRFSNLEGGFRQESEDMSSAKALEADRAKTAAKLESDRQETSRRWGNRAASLLSFAGGAALGGGGGYAAGGSGIGGLIGSAFGLPGKLIGSALGGLAGGAIDKTHDTAKNELIALSELTRRIGDVNASFSGLRDSIRHSVSEFAISNEEAAKLAINFSKLTAVGDTGLIAKAIGTSVSAAKQFGIDAGSANEFFSKTTLLGSTKNQNDFNRTMVILAESARKGGISPKMEELMASITGMMSGSASRSLMTGSIGGYADVLAAGSALPYAGLSKNPGSVASLINQFSDFTSSNGGDQGVKDHRTRALMMGFPGLDPKWFSRLRQSGTMEDPSALFSPDSPGYKGQDSKGRSEYDSAYSAIKRSGLTVGQAVAKYLDTLGLGAAERDAGFGAMTGTGPIKGSALEEIINSPKKWGKLEEKLDSFGVSKDMQGKYAGRYAELNAGGSGAANAYYEKLKKDNILDKDLQKEGDNLTGKDKEKFIYSQVVPSQADDVGYQMQKSDLQLQNDISKNLGDLIIIETASKQFLLGILNSVTTDASKSINADIAEKFKIGFPFSGKDMEGNHGVGKTAMTRVNRYLSQIDNASTQHEKDRLYNELRDSVQSEPDYYPAETLQWLDKSMHFGESEKDKEKRQLSGINGDNTPATQPAGPGYMSNVAQARAPSEYDKFFNKYSLKYGIDPRLSKMIGVHESGLNPNAISDKHSYGIMQHNNKYWGERGLNDSNWNDPETNIAAGVKYYAGLKKRYGSDESALYHYMGKGQVATDYSRNVMSEYGELKNDQLPEGHKSAQTVQNVNVTVSGQFDLNQNGQNIARSQPIFTTTRRPMQAGVKQ